QKLELKAGNALRANGRHGMIGTGVDVVALTQTRSEYYDEKYRNNNSVFGGYSTKANYMSQIQSYLNEIELQGFTTTFDKMYDTIQELEKDPANLTVRTQVMNVAQSFCEYFNSLFTNLQAIQEDCNFEIKNQVNRVNAIAAEIASLTKQINTVEIGGSNANDLRDQRNLLVDKLSEIINVSVEEAPDGPVGLKSYVVKVDGQTLVDTYETHSLKVVPSENKMNQTDADGLYSIVWDNGQQFNPYAYTQSGSIKALFEVRDGNNADNLKGTVTAYAGMYSVVMKNATVNDEATLNIPENGEITVGTVKYEYESFEVSIDKDTGEYTYEFFLKEPVRAYAEEEPSSVGVTVDYKGIPYYMAQMNEFLRTYAKKFNEIHKSGVDLNGDAGLDFFVGTNKVTGAEYKMGVFGKEGAADYDPLSFNSQNGQFYQEDTSGVYSSYYHITAENICVNKELLHDSSKFAAASDIVNGVGNYEKAMELMELKKDTSMFRQGKPSAFLQTLVAEVGIDTKAALNFSKSQNNLVNSINNQRLSVGGVDTEEEAMNLMRFQQAYKLSAQVISVMNEIYDKLINYMGV
ncbi:MAG: flagellar basal body rod C-terminal domain-containing protein, partial [Lachnospiraceae bacterium]|nr:flagellar basal body rod C-terminal domain-containing protein [Lachnospiraceae bacterium]